MERPSDTDAYHPEPGIYPPSFCNWQLLIVVMVITQIAVALAGMGRGLPSLEWWLYMSLYAQWMALFCASGLCVLRAWINRLSPRTAWLVSWFLMASFSGVFSFSVWVSAEVFQSLPDPGPAAQFVGKSVFAMALVSFAFFRYLYIRGRWRSEMTAEAEARVQALQARIRPHFLFNSLNTIASLIPDDPVSAESATLDLADIFRGNLRRADEAISLGEELDLGRQYLQMEKRRLGERLGLDWRVDELPATASILPLILQPLLENAVAHGIQRKPEGGVVLVYGRVEGDQIVITVGNPLAPAGTDTRGHGIAIDNIRERLLLAFGNRASLLTSQDGERFYAVVSFPYVEHTDR